LPTSRSSSSKRQKSTERSMAEIIKRTTLMVRDAERAAQWYEIVFGMTRWMDTPFTLSGTQLAAGKLGDKTRLVILKCEDDLVGMIGLLEWLDPKHDAPAELPTEIKFGAPVFVVSSNDGRGTVERARALGSRIHCEPRDWQVTGADGKLKDMLGCSFWDLDGYFFEVNQVVKVHE
jgi:catechol 2,3-dioxygenase-like lactoylglutathione lyase family enzyme